MKGLWDRVDFAFQKNDHTAAELLLYPQGFQLYTPTPDNGIFTALAGDDADPAIADKVFNEEDEVWEIEDSPLDADTSGNRFDPDISAELYITNGDTLDDGYHEHGILGFTPEGSEPLDENASGFVFQDDEEDVQAEFERHLLFALDLAESAADPANPVSHMGNTRRAVLRRRRSPYSYGDPQAVEVTAKRSLGDVRAAYRDQRRQASAGADQGGARAASGTTTTRASTTTACAARSKGTQAGRQRRGLVRGRRQQTSAALHLHGASARRGDEGADPVGRELHRPARRRRTRTGRTTSRTTPTRSTRSASTTTSTTSTRGATVAGPPRRAQPLRRRDLVHGRRLPDPPARPARRHRHGARLGVEEMIDVRDLPQRGRQAALHGQGRGHAVRLRRPEQPAVPQLRVPGAAGRRDGGGKWCTTRTDTDEFNENDPTMADGCIPHNDDFLQYYLGAYIRASPGNVVRHGATGTPFGLPARRAGRSTASAGSTSTRPAPATRTTRATFVVTSSILDPARFPLYASSRKAADWLRAGAAPFSPFSGTQYMAAGADSRGYKRLTQDVRPHRHDDAAAVVQVLGRRRGGLGLLRRRGARRRRADDWTTLPGRHGRADELTSDSTGESCPEGLASERRTRRTRSCSHYWNADCDPTAPAATGTPTRAAPAAGRTGHGRPLGLRRAAGRAVAQLHHRLGHARPRRLGGRRRGHATARRRSPRRTSRPTPAAGSSTRSAGGLGRAVPQLDPPRPGVRGGRRRHDRRHRLHGLRVRGHRARPHRPEFMKRALKHLGVSRTTRAAATPCPGQPRRQLAEADASAKIKVGKKLRADRKRPREGARRRATATRARPARARRSCSASAPRRGARSGSRSPAGKTKTVKVKLAEVRVQGAQAQGRPSGSPSR